MSSSEQQSQGSTFSASSSEAKRDTQGSLKQPEQVSSAGEHMKQQTDSTKDDMVSSHAVASETDSSDLALKEEAVLDSSATDESSKDLSRQLPIPPASEPKQYRAIGLIYGKYAPSDEQFTRGNLITDQGLEIDSVLLGRVMSLVKKHIDLDKSHLWVVYPRTRMKDRHLHAQVVGVWEPEKLNRLSDDELDNDAGDEKSEAAAESSAEPSDVPSSETAPETLATKIAEDTDVSPVTEDVADVSPDAEIVEDTGVSSDAKTETETETETDTVESEKIEAGNEASVAAISVSEASDAVEDAVESVMELPTDALNDSSQEESAEHSPEQSVPFISDDHGILKDGYFSIRGEVVKASTEDNEITVKIRQAPRKGSTQQRSFNLVLKGNLEGRVMGYFWDLNVQREGVDLVIQDGKMVGIVLPTKRDKKAGGRGRGGPHRGRGGPSGGKRRWNNRPTHGDRPERPDGPRRQPISKAQKQAIEKPQPNPKTN